MKYGELSFLIEIQQWSFLLPKENEITIFFSIKPFLMKINVTYFYRVKERIAVVRCE